MILKVNLQIGTVREEDLTCDFMFMMNNVHDIGRSICESHSFVTDDKLIYLFMDKAGVHGKIEVKKKYEKILEDNCNIQIEWQVPQSPETNMLDLEVW